MKQLQKKLKSGSLDVKEDDPFELFIAATDIRYCYYADTHKILGNTYGMCVLQVRLILMASYLCDPHIPMACVTGYLCDVHIPMTCVTGYLCVMHTYP